MCGIAGIMSVNGAAPAPERLRAMERLLAHRGPDGVGRYAKDDVAMVQTRLAIIDLVTGDQPLFEPGGAALIANGEIYNYRELHAELPSVAFATQSDCELPLHLYRKHGLDFARYLRGMYAIAIHDPAAHRLVLARDPFGIKPLYYVERGDSFAFASEPTALVETPHLAPDRRDELLQLQFTTEAGTIFADIERVLPGEMLVVEHGRVVARSRLDAIPAAGPEKITETDADTVARFDRVFEDSVALHQRSDVPYGMFLSGGIDSTAVLAMMARLNERAVTAFTIGFDAPGAADEREAARAVATSLGAEHVELNFSEDDFWRTLPLAVRALDDPCADYATLPTYRLGEAAQARGFKVILSGEGGDEMFAGYGRYRRLLRPRWLGGRAPQFRGALSGLGVLRDENERWRHGIDAARRTEETPERTRLQTAQAVDCTDWLPNDLLLKLDRCLMAHGVEGRTPFLDRAVADFAFRLPDELKIKNGLGKHVLRQWLATHVPAARPFARKQGFTVPVGPWIARQSARLAPLVAKSPAIAEICRPNSVEPLFHAADDRKRGVAAWHLLFYAVWHALHIERRPPGADVLETLA